MPSSKYTKCAYIKRDGSSCGKGCVGGTCAAHVRCNSQVRCGLCGRGTQSASGFCYASGDCRRAQHNTIVRLLKESKNAPPPVSGADLDALVDDLLA